MPKHLLLADDSITIQKVVAMTFAGEDFEVVAVGDGEDALARARQTRPDVVIADLVMPKKDGYALCAELKADPALRDVPVLLLAGTSAPLDPARAREARADGYIVKPFESGALIAKVKELVEREPGAVPFEFAPAPAPVVPSRPAAVPPTAPAAASPEYRPPSPVPPVPPSPPEPVPPHPPPERTVVPLPASRRAPLDLEFDLPPPPDDVAAAGGEVWADVELDDVEEPYAVGAADVELTPEVEPLRRPAAARAVGAPADGGEARLREALSLASRDVVERIAWEVVPQLAETIIREQLERLISAREQNR